MALDLNHQVPRSPFDELEGFPWLPRMIDKARAFYAGTHGDYSPYPCPGDKLFLIHFGLDAEAIGKLIRDGATEDEVAAYVKQHAKGSVETFRAAQHRPANRLVGIGVIVFRATKAKALKAKYPAMDLGKLDTFPKLLAAEEGHPIPGMSR